MADVSGNLKDWSSTASSNSPSGSTTVGTGVDDNLRELQKVVRQDLATKGADIASASTADLGAVPGLFHDITGTTTITSFGTVSAGIWKVIKFEGALTLTHNATSLILPGGANITTADGDIGIFNSEGAGNWRCIAYSSASVAPGYPPGMVSPYAGSSAPTGWLICNGQAVSRTTYATLFAVIGTTYGVGDGSTTFNVPDCTGRAVFGKEASATRITTGISGVNGGTLGATGGSESLHGHTHTGTTTSDGAHTHNVLGATIGTSGASLNSLFTSGVNTGVTDSAGAHTHTFTSASTGAGSSQNLPPAIILNYIIKT